MSLLSVAARSVTDWMKLGFPEEVAKRIVSGEIPADKAEKAKRTHELRMEANANRFGDEAPDTSYRGSHAAPDKDYGAPLHNLTDMIPEDVYGPSGKRLYGIGDSAIDDEAFSVLNAVRGNPDAGVTMYRAVPSDAPDEILDGDWVTTSREYAHMHGRNTLDGDYKVLEEPTFARRLQSEGYPYEFGYMQNGKADPRLLAGIAAGGGLLATQSEDAEAGFVTRGGKTLLEAFHGSPHKFDKFSMDQIGTGEGAQAYGHGLYFADSEDVARNYRDMLSSSSEEMETAVWALGRMGNDREAAIKALETGEGLGMAGPQSLFDDAAKLLRDEVDLSGPGALYRTEIDVTPESLLDWDKPLSEQSDYVRATLSDKAGINSKRIMSRIMDGGDSDGFSLLKDGDGYTAVADNAMFNDASDFRTKEEALNWLNERVSKYAEGSVNGSDVYRALTNEAGSDGIGQSIASNYLRENGIKGIKYLDGNSRGAGDGTSNYVIFDDSLINIAERGRATPGMMAAVAGTAGGASTIAALKSDVLDSLLNYSDDRAKKAADRRVPDARTIDEQRIANHRREVNERMHELGMLEDPLYTYRDFLPVKKNIVTGERSLAVPSSVRGMIKAILDLGSTPRTGVYNPEAPLEII